MAADRARAEAREREIQEQKEAEERKKREEEDEIMRRLPLRLYFRVVLLPLLPDILTKIFFFFFELCDCFSSLQESNAWVCLKMWKDFFRKTIESELPDEPAESETDVLHVKFRFPTGEQVIVHLKGVC